jgi:hypothetical protein
LEIENAFALMQEISTERQLQREWEHSLSERSVVFDAQTKKARFVPLERPVWMQAEIKKPGKIKVPKSMMPVGPIQGDPRMLEKLEIINDDKTPDAA